MSVTTRGSAFVWSVARGACFNHLGSDHDTSSAEIPALAPHTNREMSAVFSGQFVRLELRIFLQILDVKCEESVVNPLKTLSFLSFSENPRKGLALAPSLPPPFLAGKL